MALKFQVPTLDGLNDAVKALYIPNPQGSGFVLDAEGVVARERLDEFRNNNINLQQQLDKFKNVDPAKYAELMGLQQKLDEKKLIDAGQIDQVVEGRVATMKTTYDGQITDLTSQLNAANQQLNMLMIDQVVKSEALKLGVLPAALDDVVLRAKAVFTIDKGQPVMKQNGQVVYGKDGTTPMSITEWLTGVKTSATHLFAQSTGSGAGGGRGQPVTDMSKLSPAQKISMGLKQGGMMADLPKSTS